MLIDRYVCVCADNSCTNRQQHFLELESVSHELLNAEDIISIINLFFQ